MRAEWNIDIVEQKKLKVALAGNPNAGKTTIFNALTGARQRVSNYPGVTVEKKSGNMLVNGLEIEVVDLPGLYSLTSYSLDELAARNFLLTEKPDLIVNVVDASNFERNLFVTSQLLELEIPVVIGLNVMDLARAKGIEIDVQALQEALQVRVVCLQGNKNKGVEELRAVIYEALGSKKIPTKIEFPGLIEEKLQTAVGNNVLFVPKERFWTLKFLERDANASAAFNQEKIEDLRRIRDTIEKESGKSGEILISECRYQWIQGFLKRVFKQSVDSSGNTQKLKTQKIDAILMHPFFGLPIFIAIMWSVFQVTFLLGAYPSQWLDQGFSALSTWVSSFFASDSILRSLLVDGVIAGVGGVFSFVPLVILLFVCISFLEDVGYMARAAHIMDRFLNRFGLHGQSFLPMMVGFGCSVPAVMAARGLKSPKDRILTILIIPFMSCGAKLPVHVLLAAAFFPQNAATMVFLMYLIGIVVALFSSLALKKTILKGPATPFVLEIPDYRLPTLKSVGMQVFERALFYFKKAGTVILAASILVWMITSFPQYKPNDVEKQEMMTSISALHKDLDPTDPSLTNELDVRISQNQLTHSIAGILGKGIEPVIAPLGFDWKIGISVVTGLAAKEIVVSTLGVLYKTGSNNEDNLKQALRADPVFNPLVGFCLMVFVLLITPCIATMSTIKAELGGKWLLFSVVFTIAIAWLVVFGLNQIGHLIGA